MGPPARVTIVGGGLSGAAAALQLAGAAGGGVAITVVEPREELGRGMAYTADDPDHRLNGTPENHSLDPLDPGHVRRWIDATGLLARDPAAMAANGNVFMRRQDYGAYVRDTLRACAAVRHVRARAIDAIPGDAGVTVRTDAGDALAAELVVLATGNARPRIPESLAAALASHPAVIPDPLDLERIRAIPPDARVLLLGSGLTALDVASTLVRRGHRGLVTVASRRGVRPRPHRLAPAGKGGPTLLERIEGPLPDFVRAAGSPPRLRALLRGLRRRIAEVEARGGDWYGPFDEMRDGVWQFWPAVPAAEKRRFQRRLRHWYDAHRFRAPPQNDSLVREAERAGRVRFVVIAANTAVVPAEAAHGLDAGLRGNDVVINCTGLDPAAGADDNPLLAALLDRGVLTLDASGMGFAVDSQCRPIGRDGASHARLRLVGPPTAGVFGDPLGVPFIVPQVRRILPGMLATLGLAAAPVPCR